MPEISNVCWYSQIIPSRSTKIVCNIENNLELDCQSWYHPQIMQLSFQREVPCKIMCAYQNSKSTLYTREGVVSFLAPRRARVICDRVPHLKKFPEAQGNSPPLVPATLQKNSRPKNPPRLSLTRLAFFDQFYAIPIPVPRYCT